MSDEYKDPEFIEHIKKELKQNYLRYFLETVTGPDVYGVGNFELYLDTDNEWDIRPVKSWKPPELLGIINEE